MRALLPNLIESIAASAECSVPYTTIWDRFLTVARHAPSRVAVSWEEGEITWGALASRATGVATCLADVGIGHGDVVAFLLPPDADHFACFLGILQRGAILLSLDAASPPDRLRRVLEHSGAAAVFVNAATRSRIESLGLPVLRQIAVESVVPCPVENLPPSPAASDSVASLLYTSGSTGEPKGVMQLHRNHLRISHQYRTIHAITPEDRVALALPPSGASARTDIHAALMCGGILACRHLARHGAAGLGEWVDDQAITILHLVPTLYRAMVRALPPDRVLSSVRVVRLGGEALRQQDLETFARHFPPDAVLSWSLSTTEASFATMMHWRAGDPPPGDPLPSGFPMPDPGIIIVDEQGTELPAGTTGRIVQRGTVLSPGYWHAPETTAKFFSDDPVGGGVRRFFTGDLGHIDAQGRLVHEGRLDYHVKIAGNRIDPAEVEEAICRHPDVDEGVVIPRTPATGDSWLHAFVTVRGTVTTAQLKAHVAGLLPAHLVPARIEFLDRMPLTATGKVDRAGLRKRSEAPEAAAPERPADHFELGLRDVWREILRQPELGIDAGFFEHGGSSLDAVTALEEVRRRFGAEIEPQALLESPTPRELAAHLRGAAPRRWRHLMGVSTTGDGLPFYCVPPNGRTAYSFEPLGRLMAGERPLYTFHPLGALPGETPHRTIAEMAAAYVRELLDHRPEGPFLLGGRCGGGMVAWEMARQLTAAGHEVPVVVLLETKRAPYPADRLLRLRYATAVVAGLPFAPRAGEASRWFVHRMLARLRAPGHPAAREPENDDAPSVFPSERERAMLQAHNRACLHYRVAPAATRLALVLAEAGNAFIDHQRAVLWRLLARRGTEFHVLPGDHLQTLAGDNLVRAAGVVLDICRRAEQSAG
ncbi:MAG: AMP-binding protein [Candidatus Sumerlaeia bacterium]|nr:AMP-binding protein [Candidatus Sumerlaeia bacterium]